MSEPTTSESEAPRKVAKKKGRAKASRKKATKPSASPGQTSEAPESSAASAEAPPSSPSQTSIESEARASGPRGDAAAEPKSGQNGASPAAHAEHEDRRSQKVAAPSDNGASTPRGADETSKERSHDRGQGGTGFQETRNARNRRRNRGDRDRGGNQPSAIAHRRVPEVAIDMEELKAKAWHIYSTEVCEEGIRFVDDTDAGKLVRRCYKLAETFLRFQYRQQGGRPDRDDPGPSLEAESSGREAEADVETPF